MCTQIHLEILLKCSFQLGSSGVGPEILLFQQASRWYRGSLASDHSLSSKNLLRKFSNQVSNICPLTTPFQPHSAICSLNWRDEKPVPNEEERHQGDFQTKAPLPEATWDSQVTWEGKMPLSDVKNSSTISDLRLTFTNLPS